MKGKKNCIFNVSFLVVIFGVMLGTVLMKDQEYSENENKYLAQKPHFSLEDVMSGDFMENTGKYMNDQLFLRQKWIQLKTKSQKLAGNKEINGVYLADDDYLIEKWTKKEVDMVLLEENIGILDQFAEKYKLPTSALIVPTAGEIYRDKLPANAPMFQQEQVLQNIGKKLNMCQYIDVGNVLKTHKNEETFYRTDHHWTTYGAFLGYQNWAKGHGKNVVTSEYQIETVTDKFLGTLYSKVLDDSVKNDNIDLYDDKKMPKYKVSYNFGKKESDSVYEMENLRKKDKYQVFLGGNHPELTITTGNKNGKHLMIFKDSFANAFIPFLIPDYETIHVIDMRYFKADVDKYISQNSINETLFLYNLKNFASDDSIQTIL